MFLSARQPTLELSASPPRESLTPGAGDTFKLRGVPKARVTNRRAKARRGPANSHRGVTLREMLQWMIRSQAPTAPSRGATGKVQRLDGGGRGTEAITAPGHQCPGAASPAAKVKSGPAGNCRGLKREPAA